jgi:hypothetical protein
MFKIVNNNDKMPNGDSDFIARHNGLDYAFPRHKAVYCPDEAAKHIFAIGDPDKASVIARHGWAPPSATLQTGLKVLNNFSFEYMAPVFDAPMAAIERMPEIQEEEFSAHGPAPVVQDALGGEAAATAMPPGAVAERRPPGRQVGRLPPLSAA